jgi:hypothetical protein
VANCAVSEAAALAADQSPAVSGVTVDRVCLGRDGDVPCSRASAEPQRVDPPPSPGARRGGGLMSQEAQLSGSIAAAQDGALHGACSTGQESRAGLHALPMVPPRSHV